MLKHISVMKDEVIKMLDPRKGGNYIDATVGLGGHSKEILQLIGKNGKLLCIDQNSKSLEQAKKNLTIYSAQCIFVHDNFANIKEIVKNTNFNNIDGILYDLGLASWQIDKGGLGISFSSDEPLDMRLHHQISNIKNQKNFNNLTAEQLINKFPVKKIADILFQYGDVRNSWSVARRIDIARRNKPIKTTFQLVSAIGTTNPKILAPIFQSLRIYVNNELKNLEKTLIDAINLVKIGGIIVAIAFHSGEDRVVKNIFRQCAKEKKAQILTKKPITPTIIEINTNSRARSAKLRAIKKIG